MISRILLTLILSGMGNITNAQITVAHSGNYLFDDNWLFLKGDAEGAYASDFNDRFWRTLDLPHDWSIEDLPGQSDSIKGPFHSGSIGSTSTGYTIGGTGWYRKKFIVNQKDKDKRLSILFDGVYMNRDIWINGYHLGNHPYGYSPFYYDLTPFLIQTGKENCIAVRVRNEGQNSRWYTGSGIYRHVWLTVANPVHTGPWGVYITTPEATEKKAVITASVSVINEDVEAARVTIKTTILGPGGKTAGVSEITKTLLPGYTPITQIIRLSNPRLWSPDYPKMYTAETIIIKKGLEIDRTKTPFGVRTIMFDREAGFMLNGHKLLIRGGSVHHDNGRLGSATIDRAEERKVALLKSYGFNAVRTSHNPPSKQFLDACDSIGLLVIDEAFDMWAVGKKPQDYHLYFNEWWKKDLENVILRDRNHPSIILWSIGNEVKEVADSAGLLIASKLRESVRSLDTTRPVTAAICDFWDRKDLTWQNTAPAFDFLDVGGYNYEWKRYESDHIRFPERVILGTESFPKESFENWQIIEKYRWLSGDFVWTAMDYIGETAIGHSVLDNEKDGGALEWPWFNGFCGDIDLIGGKKPQSYYRDILWNRLPLALLVHNPIPEGRTEIVSKWGWPNESPSWTWPGQEGNHLQVNVYSRHPLIKLFLNGKLIDEKMIADSNGLTATFTVLYVSGELKAVAMRDGKEVASVVLRTCGEPLGIRLRAESLSDNIFLSSVLKTGTPITTIRKNRNNLCYIIAEIVDQKGNVVPGSVFPINFSLQGEAEIAGVGNANPKDLQSFQQPACRTFNGKCMVIIRPKGKKSSILLKATAENLTSGQMAITAL